MPEPGAVLDPGPRRKFPDLFDTVLQDAGIEVVLSGVQMPRMNAFMERWVQTCRRELLDRTPTRNQRHLLHALREFEQFYRLPPTSPGNRQRPAAARTALTHPRSLESTSSSPAALTGCPGLPTHAVRG